MDPLDVRTARGMRRLDSGAVAVNCLQCHVEVIASHARALLAMGWRAGRPTDQAVIERRRLPRYCPRCAKGLPKIF
jgi:hypothetical protein